MYERFTDRARKVMLLANQEAQRFNHEYIGTEHVLLGVVKEGSGVAANVLKNLDIDLGNIRLDVEKLIQSGPEMVTMGKLPQTPRTKRAIEKAMEVSRELNHNYVGTEHLLLGLIQTGGLAQDVLANLGVTAEHARTATLVLLGHGADDTDDLVRDGNSWPHPWYHSATRRERVGRTSLVAQAGIGFPPFRGPQQLNPLITALNRKWRHSVLIVGERGVGKRALVERLAHEIANGHSSAIHACGKRLTELHLADSAARLEKRISRLVDGTIALLDNIHLGLDHWDNEVRYAGTRRRRRVVESSPSFAQLLATWLSKGGRCIATTTEEHVDTFFANEELSAHFSPLRLSPATSEQSIEVAKSRADEYEHNQSVRFDDDAYREACELADHYGDVLFPRHAQPELTLDVLEHAAAYTDWKRHAKDAKASDAADDSVVELHAHDIQHAVALRLGKDIDDVKARK